MTMFVRRELVVKALRCDYFQLFLSLNSAVMKNGFGLRHAGAIHIEPLGCNSKNTKTYQIFKRWCNCFSEQ